MIRVCDIGGATHTKNARRDWSERRGLRIELAADGVTGLGECSPLPGVSSETLEDVRAELEALADLPLDQLREAKLSSSARFGLDTALLDLRAQREDTSVAELLAGKPPVDVGASTLLGDPRARNEPHTSIRCAKLKVGPAIQWPAQLEAINHLSAAHPDLLLRLDFNGSLSAREARAILADIDAARWPIDYVEDPTDLPAAIECEVDLAVDSEALLRIDLLQVVDLAASNQLQVAVLKPALLGGLHQTFAMATALTPHLDVVISHLLDGPIALAACAELACATATLKQPARAAGVGPHDALAAYSRSVSFESVLRPSIGGLRIAR